MSSVYTIITEGYVPEVQYYTRLPSPRLLYIIMTVRFPVILMDIAYKCACCVG